MSKFTVVLRRPSEFVELHDATEFYVANRIDAKSVEEAVIAAQKELFKADKKDKIEPSGYTIYELVVVLSGHPDVIRFGWQK